LTYAVRWATLAENYEDLPMRTELGIKLKLSETLALGGEFGNHNWTEVDDSHDHGDSRLFKIPASETDYEIDLTGVITTASLVALRTNQDINLKVNSDTATAVAISVVSTNRYGYFLASGNITKLYITTGGTSTEVVLGFVGDD